MKKFISLLLALVMALSLVACGSKNNTDDTQNTTPDDAQTPAETVELTVFAAASLTASLTAIGEKYMAENENVKITLPLVLPPTVVGYLILRVLGPKRLIGAWVLETFGIRLVMTWWSAIFATVIVVFPLMYRTVRGAFESFDETLAYAGRTLGLSKPLVYS